eukprot:2336471-Rhodomonas_salina.2
MKFSYLDEKPPVPEEGKACHHCVRVECRQASENRSSCAFIATAPVHILVHVIGLRQQSPRIPGVHCRANCNALPMKALRVHLRIGCCWLKCGCPVHRVQQRQCLGRTLALARDTADTRFQIVMLARCHLFPSDTADCCPSSPNSPSTRGDAPLLRSYAASTASLTQPKVPDNVSVRTMDA